MEMLFWFSGDVQDISTPTSFRVTEVDMSITLLQSRFPARLGKFCVYR